MPTSGPVPNVIAAVRANLNPRQVGPVRDAGSAEHCDQPNRDQTAARRPVREASEVEGPYIWRHVTGGHSYKSWNETVSYFGYQERDGIIFGSSRYHFWSETVSLFPEFP